MLDHGADFIKLIATGAVLAIGGKPGALQLSPEEMKAACDEAKVHGTTASPTPMAPRGSRRRSAPAPATIEHASYLDAEGIALAKTHGVWLDMDIYNGDWINDVGVKQGWPAEYLRKNIETTDVQRRGIRRGGEGGAQADLRDRRGRVHVRPGRAAVRRTWSATG